MLPSTSNGLPPATQDTRIAYCGIAVYLMSNDLCYKKERFGRMLHDIVELSRESDLCTFLRFTLSSKLPTFDALAESLFQIAIEDGNDVLVKQLLLAGYDPRGQMVNGKYGWRVPALHHAVQNGNRDVVQMLLDSGVDIEARDSRAGVGVEARDCGEGLTALHVAALRGYTQIVQLLIDSGSEIDAKDRHGETPLHYAAEGGYLDALNTLLAAGSDINCKDGENRTVIERDFHMHRAGIAEAAVKAGASLDSIYEDVGLEQLVYCQDAQLLRDIMQAYELNLQRALAFAVDAEALNLVELLIDEGADIDATIIIAFSRDSNEENLTCEKRMFHGEEFFRTVNVGRHADHILVSLLTLAAMTNNEAIVRHLLRSGSRVDGSWWSEDLAPIHAASYQEDDAIAKVLLDAGANFGVFKDNNDSSLDVGFREQVYLIEPYLEGKYSQFKDLCICPHLDIRCLFMGLALRNAAHFSHDKLVKALLDIGAWVNVPATCHTSTALQAAVKAQCMPAFQTLLAAGADVNAAPEQQGGRTALQEAVQGADLQFGRDLIAAGANLDGSAAKYRGVSVLSYAIRGEETRMIDYLLAMNVNVNNPPRVHGNGRTPLAEASISGNIELVRRLIYHGAIANDFLAVTGAILLGHYDIFEFLLAVGAIALGGEGGMYAFAALQVAVNSSQLKFVLMILESGVDVDNATPVSGRVPPFRSCSFAKIGCPIHVSIREDIDIVSQRMRDAGFNGQLVWQFAHPGRHEYITPQNLERLRLLLRAGADFEAKYDDLYKQTPLQHAAREGNIDIVNALLEAGANFEGRHSAHFERSPLQHAAEEGHTNVVHALLKAGADVNGPPNSYGGVTALQAAALTGHLGVVKVLLEANADVNAPAAPHHGRTALEAAAEHGRIDVLQILVDNGASIQGPGKAQYERALEFATSEGHLAAKRLLQSLWDDALMGEFLDFPDSPQWNPRF